MTRKGIFLIEKFKIFLEEDPQTPHHIHEVFHNLGESLQAFLLLIGCNFDTRRPYRLVCPAKSELRVYLVHSDSVASHVSQQLGWQALCVWYQIEYLYSKLNGSCFPVKIQDGMENIIMRLEQVWSEMKQQQCVESWKCLCWVTRATRVNVIRSSVA